VSPREKRRSRGVAFLILALLCSGVMIGIDSILGRQLLQERRARLEWTPVDAVVRSSEVEKRRSEDGTTYSPKVAFRYRFEGAQYESSRYAFGHFRSNDLDYAREVVHRHPEGSAISVHVDPEDPGEAVVDVTGQAFPSFIVVFLTPFHCMAVLALGSALRALTAGRSRSDRRYRDLVAMVRTDRLILREPRRAPWEITLITFGGLAMLCGLPLIFALGLMGASAWTVPVLTGCAVGAAVSARVSRSRNAPRFLQIDRRLGTFASSADEDAAPIRHVRSLKVRSRDSDVAVNEVPQFDHVITAELEEGPLPVFSFRGERNQGQAVRDALASEFGLPS